MAHRKLSNKTLRMLHAIDKKNFIGSEVFTGRDKMIKITDVRRSPDGRKAILLNNGTILRIKNNPPNSIVGSTKPSGIKIMDAEKTIKGMQIKRNKRRKELGLPQIKHFS